MNKYVKLIFFPQSITLVLFRYANTSAAAAALAGDPTLTAPGYLLYTSEPPGAVMPKTKAEWNARLDQLQDMADDSAKKIPKKGIRYIDAGASFEFFPDTNLCIRH